MARLVTWQRMAGRCGALEIYGFGMAMQKVAENLHLTPTILGILDKAAKKAADKLFASYFPAFAKVRVSAAHPGQLGSTPEGFKKNAWQGTYNRNGITFEAQSPFYMEAGLMGNEFTSTVEGQMVSYAISEETTERLTEVATIYFSAFEGIQKLVRYPM